MPTSGDFWSPASWAALAREIGIAGFFLFFMLVGLFLLLGFLVRRIFGKNGLAERFWDRTDKFLETIEVNTTTTAETLRKHTENCDRIYSPGGPSNVEDIREAAHSFAEMGRKMGEKAGVDVEQQVGDVHKALRSKPD